VERCDIFFLSGAWTGFSHGSKEVLGGLLRLFFSAVFDNCTLQLICPMAGLGFQSVTFSTF